MNLTDWTPWLLATGAASLIFFFLMLTAFRRLRKRQEMELRSFREEQAVFLQDEISEKLGKMEASIRAENAKQWDALKEETKQRFDFETGLLRAKIDHAQPSYPKRLEAQQKLAVLVNTLGHSLSSPDERINAGSVIRNYLIQYSGIVSQKTENLLLSALDALDLPAPDQVLQQLNEAKQSSKENAPAR